MDRAIRAHVVEVFDRVSAATHRWWWRVRAALMARSLERDLDDELTTHLELHIREHVNSGLDPAEARRRALIALGGLQQTKERCRDHF